MNMPPDFPNSIGENDPSFLQDDGYETPLIKLHSPKKHRMIRLFAYLFSKATLKKWQCRVYIDLFSATGRAKLPDERIVNTSPLIALEVLPPFDKYIFCEKDPRSMEALKLRVKKLHPKADVNFVCGDCNQNIDEVIKGIPRFSQSYHVISFCLIDPFGASDFHFGTIRKLSQFRMDFLVLIPDTMDLGRWWKKYFEVGNQTIENFLAIPDWRDKWEIWRDEQVNRGRPGSSSLFIFSQFIKQMEGLGFRSLNPSDMEQVRQIGNRSPLYKLALFSKSDLALYLWDQTKKYTDPQMNFLGALTKGRS